MAEPVLRMKRGSACRIRSQRDWLAADHCRIWVNYECHLFLPVELWASMLMLTGLAYPTSRVRHSRRLLPVSRARQPPGRWRRLVPDAPANRTSCTLLGLFLQ